MSLQNFDISQTDRNACIRIFVGTSPDGMDLEAEIALEHSIRSRTRRAVEIVWMELSRDPASPFYSDVETGEGFRTAGWTTPFSQFRWRIPGLCGFHGRAIYLDVDTLALADIGELWDAPLGRGVAWMGKSPLRACTMLIDCAAAKLHHQFSRNAPFQPFPLGQNWNCLDGEGLEIGDPAMKLLHFTTITAQPHLVRARERLARQGKRHWFTGDWRAHWRPDLDALWHDEYLAGVVDGYGGRARPEFGAFPLQSHANFRGVRPR